jgi:hypothetical protein
VLQPRIYPKKEICPQFPPTYLPFYRDKFL